MFLAWSSIYYTFTRHRECQVETGPVRSSIPNPSDDREESKQCFGWHLWYTMEPSTVSIAVWRACGLQPTQNLNLRSQTRTENENAILLTRIPLLEIYYARSYLFLFQSRRYMQKESR